MSAPRVGIVTVTYNSGSFLDAFFDSCRSQSIAGWRMYAIDNASVDDSLDRLRQVASTDVRIHVVVNEKNVGVAEGNNQGILQALADGCEWVLLLNNDTTFAPDMLVELLAACSDREWQVCVPKIYYDEPVGHLWYAGGGFNPHRGYTGYHIGKQELDRGQHDVPSSVDYSPTCCMLVHQSVFKTVGLMDETYFVYFDDTDFCWRLRKQRISIGYWPLATLVHKVGGSTGGGDSPFTARMTARNRLYFLKKHFGAAAALRWSFVFSIYYVARYLLRRWNPACFFASVQGSQSYKSLVPRVPQLPTGHRS
jgi:GT2 family glycosyltransferase